MIKLQGESIYLAVLERGDCKKLYEDKEEYTATLSEWRMYPSALCIIIVGDVSGGFVRVCYRGPNLAWIEDIIVDSDKRGKGITSATF